MLKICAFSESVTTSQESLTHLMLDTKVFEHLREGGRKIDASMRLRQWMDISRPLNTCHVIGAYLSNFDEVEEEPQRLTVHL